MDFFLIASESYLISDFLKLDIQNTKPGDVGGSCILFFVFFVLFFSNQGYFWAFWIVR